MQQPRSASSQAPAPPAAAAPVVAQPSPPAVPLTAREVAAIRARRQELSNQLESADGRRNQIARQLQSATGANRAGLEARLSVLDQRIAGLETDLETTGRQLTSAPAGLETYTLVPPAREVLARDMAPIAATFTIFVLFPVAFAYARRIWRRADAPALPPRWPETEQRLERIEHAVDAIAIEVERVSENQRFLTRVLTEAAPGRSAAESSAAEGPPLALGAGSAPFEPLVADQREAVPAANRRR